MTVAHNIYIHVPFCMSKCNYCAFFSRACAAPDWRKYTDDILSEIDFWAGKLGRIDVPTIFFGGGTPSLMPTANFSEIMERMRDRFNIAPNAEITIESNPGTLDATRLDEFIAAGVNRLSIGVQSLDDDELLFLGRRHTVADALRLIDAAKSRDIRVSADFIYGLPGHNATKVKALCQNINKIGFSHCSMYELTIEPNTPFGKMNLDMPSNAEMADMYNTIDETLNLSRYEVSNYATPGFECRHNQNIWDGDAYIGIGNGAAGRVFLDGVWYEQLGAGARFEPITTQSRAVEKIITGLRTTRGLLLAPDIKNAINMEYLNQNQELLEIADGRIRATKRGMLILDELVLNLVK
ncbi:MAG: radical SAM family heme chaperone HemW [Alphaproteobacteria bacterium]|nr:radical SAM family heme chaperone HemW [Alphaproteobacteria bacterium]